MFLILAGLAGDPAANASASQELLCPLPLTADIPFSDRSKPLLYLYAVVRNRLWLLVGSFFDVSSSLPDLSGDIAANASASQELLWPLPLLPNIHLLHRSKPLLYLYLVVDDRLWLLVRSFFDVSSSLPDLSGDIAANASASQELLWPLPLLPNIHLLHLPKPLLYLYLVVDNRLWLLVGSFFIDSPPLAGLARDLPHPDGSSYCTTTHRQPMNR